MVMIEFK